MTEPNTELPPLRVRIAQAMAAHPSLGGLYSDHPDSYLNPHKGATADYVTEADTVLAVVEAEVDRIARARDSEVERLTTEVERLRARVHTAVDETQRRYAPFQSRCHKFDVWSKWAREAYERHGGQWGMESEATRLVVQSLLQERDALSGLLRDAARKISEFRRALNFADAHVPQWERIIAEHKAENERRESERQAIAVAMGLKPDANPGIIAEWAGEIVDSLNTLRWLHAEAMWHAERHRADVDTRDLALALQRAGFRSMKNQVDAMARKIREQDQQLALAMDTLGAIWLYVKWRYVTGKLTTEQRELWAAAVDAFGEPQDGKAERWWRDDFVEAIDPVAATKPRPHEAAVENAVAGALTHVYGFVPLNLRYEAASAARAIVERQLNAVKPEDLEERRG